MPGTVNDTNIAAGNQSVAQTGRVGLVEYLMNRPERGQHIVRASGFFTLASVLGVGTSSAGLNEKEKPLVRPKEDLADLKKAWTTKEREETARLAKILSGKLDKILKGHELSHIRTDSGRKRAFLFAKSYTARGKFYERYQIRVSGSRVKDKDGKSINGKPDALLAKYLRMGQERVRNHMAGKDNADLDAHVAKLLKVQKFYEAQRTEVAATEALKVADEIARVQEFCKDPADRLENMVRGQELLDPKVMDALAENRAELKRAIKLPDGSVLGFVALPAEPGADSYDAYKGLAMSREVGAKLFVPTTEGQTRILQQVLDRTPAMLGVLRGAGNRTIVDANTGKPVLDPKTQNPIEFSDLPRALGEKDYEQEFYRAAGDNEVLVFTGLVGKGQGKFGFINRNNDDTSGFPAGCAVFHWSKGKEAQVAQN